MSVISGRQPCHSRATCARLWSDVDERERGRRHLELREALEHGLPQVEEELVLEVVGALLGVQHAVLEVLQLRRDVALGVLDRLAPDVVGRDALPPGACVTSMYQPKTRL